MRMARVRAMRKAGRNPATKSPAMEIPPIAPRITIRRQGGMSMPMPAAAPMSAAAWEGLYFARIIEGIRRVPMAEASASAAPEMPEKNISATTMTNPSPPRICPTRLWANSTSRRLIPPVSINPPVRINSGMAKKGKDSIPEASFWGTICRGSPPLR